MGARVAGAGARVSGEEERGGHDQGPGPAEGAEATPQHRGGQEHHQFTTRAAAAAGSRISSNPPSASPSASAVPRARGYGRDRRLRPRGRFARDALWLRLR